MHNHALRIGRTTIRVNQRTLRLAETLAGKYKVTVSHLVEILMRALKERSEWEPLRAFKERSKWESPTPSSQRSSARVIDLHTARERVANRRLRRRFA